MESLKQQAAKAALDFIDDDMIVGVGTGSTVNFFIEQLAVIKHRIDACVASSLGTQQRLRALGIPVVDLNVAGEVAIYIDGADEVTTTHQMIKGGGGALTREKILAAASRQFICIVDESKLVNRLGVFPVAVEVIPMARSMVARELVKLGGDPEYRDGFVTDNGNIILDVYNFEIEDATALEQAIKLLPGVVENGLFARQLADKVIVAAKQGIRVV
ncbi:ribose-5-phosphate isomerase RpiA [Legionella sp. 16cNR16C]|uniref:ribose-5-phosphate isomerase RpiA n=1 Tax=Legionella sp. 16cNR16C TaxID=2905656 RepID=UPI001E3CE811|nr:ribose-5-phosphate isomerase RpiA [Legionella sp. 16cNR16C]MCE3045182.1 ribose-5-phosphate isomerase RpiA [Legionella sp. 16cNR16C]